MGGARSIAEHQGRRIKTKQRFRGHTLTLHNHCPSCVHESGRLSGAPGTACRTLRLSQLRDDPAAFKVPLS